MSKKILAVLISLLMISSAVGMPVFADDVETENAEATETIVTKEVESNFFEADIDFESTEEMSENEETMEFVANDDFADKETDPTVISEIDNNEIQLMSVELMSLSGSGTAADPYLIYTQDDLLSIDSYPAASYSLQNDIVVTYDTWTPIGASTEFSGSFNGNGYTVSGVILDGSGYEYTGFFGKNSGRIENLTVDVKFSASNYVGGLVAYNAGTVANCLVTGAVTNTSSGSTGGLIGENRYGTIRTSGSTASVTGGSGNTGGLVGYNNNDYSQSAYSTITNCYAQGNVTGTGNTGGLVGRNYAYYGSNYAIIRNCYASGKVNDGEGAGLIGSNNGRYYNSYYRSINTGNTIGFSVSTTNMKKQNTFYCWDFNNIWTMGGDYPYINVRGEDTYASMSGGGTLSNPYLIESEQQLYSLATDLITANSSTYYKLANNITITTKYWTPIGVYDAFSGNFDGNGYTISGASISGTNYSDVGLFGRNAGAIKNLIVSGNISGSGSSGILVGYNEGTVSNCLSTGTVSNASSGSTGGLIGENRYGTIRTSGSTASVTGGSGNTGGLVGYNNNDYSQSVCSTITNCYAQGNVTGTGNTGGLVGRNYAYYGSNYAIIRNCYASGKVNDGEGAGLIGSHNGRWYNSYYRSINTGNTIGFSVSTTNMKKQDTFYCWDFDNIWEINGGYPYINIRGEESEILFDGDGDIEEPYYIETEQQLYALSVDLAKTGSKIYYQLANDITITAMYWTPIGVYDNFVGIFDGDGYTISGASISGTSYTNVGLFGRNAGTIKNLAVSGNISGSGSVGLLSGYNEGTIISCLSKGTVSNTASGSTGGLIGENRYGTIRTSGSTVSVTGGNGNTGGLVGYNNNDYSQSAYSTITNCYAQGNVTGTGNTGGLVGRNYAYYGSNYAIIRNCYASGNVNTGSGAGLIDSNNGRYYNSYYNASNSGNTNGFAVSAENLKNQSTYYFWDFDNIWDLSGEYPYINIRGDEVEILFDGDGDEEEPYYIETEQQLYALSVDLAKTGSKIYYQLANDITITAMYWTPIGVYDNYIGVFDGNGYTISGASISGTSYTNVGLFGRNAGTIKNLVVSGNVSGSGSVGLLSGYNEGTIISCLSKGTVSNTASGSTGGLIGENRYGTIRTSGSTVSVTGGKGNTGGLVGYNNNDYSQSAYSTITNCYAQGNVTGTGNTGGLVGRNYAYYGSNYAVITNTYSIGVVSSVGTRGGLVGYNNGTVTSSYYDTKISQQNDTTKGTPASTDDMKNISTYAGWDFDSTWAIESSKNKGYPYLQSIVPASSVAVTGVTLNKNSLTLDTGKSETLTANVTPSDASNKAVTWSSSDTSVATVSNGRVTAKAAGTATITVTTSDGGYTATCTVNVSETTVAVTGIKLNKTSATINVNGTETLTATITPTNATNKNITWTSTNTSVATVANGVVTAKSTGTAIIIATTADGGFTATCNVTVPAQTVSVTGITLNKSETTIEINDTDTLTATVLPINATNKNVTWTSSNTSVVVVADGVVTAKSAGTAVITAKTADGGFTATCTVTVPSQTISVTGITLDKTSTIMTLNNTETITATITPSNATNKNIIWTSTDTSVATVANGIITAKSYGTAIIIASTADGGYTATCTVNIPEPQPVYVPVTGITLDRDYLHMNHGESVQLNATITPSNATNKNIIWTSSNPFVATVDDGLVTVPTMTSGWSATITATTEDGNYTAECIVTVPIHSGGGGGELTGIKVTPPTNTTVTEGMALDVTGLVVEAVYDDDETEEVTDYTLSGYDKDKIGKQIITVTYEDFSEDFEITVEAKKPIGIMLSQKPDKRSYTQGESLDTTGMIVTALYNNNTTEDISDYTVSGYNANTTGTQTIMVTYNSFTTMFTVTVTPKAQQTGTVEAPKMSIASYIGGKTVTLTTATDGASIYYTTDGSAPTSSSTLYTAPIEFTETQTLKAIAVKDNMNDSKAVSGKISVSTVEKPVSSHVAGQVDTGTIITLKSATSGATIYYTTDETTPTTESAKYTGSIAITKDMTVKAIAVKDGCKTSDIYTVAYTIPYVAPDNATVSVGSVTAAAGDMVSVPVYIFAEENITDYRFSISFDDSVFEYVSVTPADGVSSSDLFTSVNGNTVTVLYSGAEVESGEMCSINLNALSSAIDGDYDITVNKDNIKIATAFNNNLDIDVVDGSITLSGSTNSNLDKVSAEAVLTDKDGNDISNASNITDEVTANIVIDDVQEDAVSTAVIANVILAVYDRKGMLVSLSTVEADLTDINYVFSHTIEIPEDVSVGSIKMLIWNGLGDMTPLMAASSLI